MNTSSSLPTSNVLHVARRIRSNYGIVKVPFTLRKPVSAKTLHKKLAAFGEIKTLKLCTATYGWVHFTSFNPPSKHAM